MNQAFTYVGHGVLNRSIQVTAASNGQLHQTFATECVASGKGLEELLSQGLGRNKYDLLIDFGLGELLSQELRRNKYGFITKLPKSTGLMPCAHFILINIMSLLDTQQVSFERFLLFHFIGLPSNFQLII